MTSDNTYNSYLLQDPFVSGKVAMKIQGDHLIGQIKNAQAALPDKAVKNWDVVTVPVNPLNPEVRSDSSPYEILAISANAVNAEAAWKFVSYVTSEEFV